jgi:TolB-like protein/Tfp pilus assembly protein PilF
MSETGRAVFLSYASQDAAAAKRICDSLRAAGVEVWFDQNELVGGDAWDAKIRGHIRECALLVPVISRTTQARREAYFRLEWKLADERTHLMAKGTPFLLPVTIDETTERGALVPDSFVAVQWTKAPGGDLPAAFVQRVVRLLTTPEASAVAAPVPGPGGRTAPTRNGRALVIAGVVAVAALSAFGVWWAREMTGRMKQIAAAPAPAGASVAAAPQTEARRLAEQAMQLLDDGNLNRESSWLADELCERALKLDGGDAEVWAAAALASVNLASNVYDTSSARREKAREQSQRALQLDRNSIRAGLAVARYEERWGSDAEALRQLQELLRRAPDDQRVMHFVIRVAGNLKDEAAVQTALTRLRAAPRTPLLAQTLWFEMLRLRTQGRFADAMRINDELLQDAQPIRGAYYERLFLLHAPWQDFEKLDAFIAQIPSRFLQEPAFGSFLGHYRLMRGDAEGALSAVAHVPQDYFEEFNAREPKGLASGWAHALAGRPTAAQAEWRGALALIEERLRADARVRTYLGQRALLLALTGRRDEAREARKLWVEMNGEGTWSQWCNPVLLHTVLGEIDDAAVSLEKHWPGLTAGRRVMFLQLLRFHPVYADLRRDARVERFIAAQVRAFQEEWRRQQAAPGPDAAVAPAVDERSVAVLAFANLSSDKEQEYFSDGISEELLNVLAKVPGLKVSARTSAFHFKGKDTPIAEIAKQLGVAYVVEGSVRKAGDKVRITAQLIKAADGFHVWSDTFTRDLKDIFAVQDEIAGLITQQLQLKLGSSAAVRPVNPEAHRLLLEGRHYWGLRTLDGFDRAEAAFRRAAEIDPELAPAHAGVAVVMATRVAYLAYIGERFPSLEPIRAAARRALAINPSLPEAQAALAFALVIEGATAESEREYQKALAMNPNSALLHHWYALTLEIRGRLDEALAEITRATELDPLSGTALITRQRMAIFARRYDEASAMFARAEGLLPERESILAAQAICLLQLGRADEAAAVARKVSADSSLNRRIIADAHVVHVLRATGHVAEAEAHATAIMRRMLPDSYQRGVILAALGRWDEAEPFLAQTPTTLRYIYLWDPLWDAWRDDPRFSRLLEKLGSMADYKVARATLERMQREAGASR